MPLITISRSIGCSSRTIARFVAEHLNLDIYDNQNFQNETRGAGIQPAELELFEEKPPSFFDRHLGNRSQLYPDLMEWVVYEVARRGRGVILMLGSHLFLRKFSTVLNVLLCASECCRVEHLIQRHRLRQDAAEKLIRKCECERKSFLRYLGQMDCNDPSLHNLVINTGKMDIDEAAELILKAANSRKYRECNQKEMDAMERLALRKRIKIELLKSNLKISFLQLGVPEKGVAHIRGWTKTKGICERLINILDDVPGVTKVVADISVGCWSPTVFVKR